MKNARAFESWIRWSFASHTEQMPGGACISSHFKSCVFPLPGGPCNRLLGGHDTPIVWKMSALVALVRGGVVDLTSVNCAKFEVVSCLHEFVYRYRQKMTQVYRSYVWCNLFYLSHTSCACKWYTVSRDGRWWGLWTGWGKDKRSQMTANVPCNFQLSPFNLSRHMHVYIQTEKLLYHKSFYIIVCFNESFESGSISDTSPTWASSKKRKRSLSRQQLNHCSKRCRCEVVHHCPRFCQKCHDAKEKQMERKKDTSIRFTLHSSRLPSGIA